MKKKYSIQFDCALELYKGDDYYSFYYNAIDDIDMLDFLVEYKFKRLIEFNVLSAKDNLNQVIDQVNKFTDFKSIYEVVKKLSESDDFFIDKLEIEFDNFIFYCSDFGVFFTFKLNYFDEIRSFIDKILIFSFDFDKNVKLKILDKLFMEINKYIKIDNKGVVTGVYIDYFKYLDSKN